MKARNKFTRTLTNRKNVKKKKFIPLIIIVAVIITVAQVFLLSNNHAHATNIESPFLTAPLNVKPNLTALGPPDLGHNSPVGISVIIPVYKVVNYIERCIKSLITQSFRDIEFIFVDDCGNDGSIQIVERYAKEDNRIKIIRNKENIGSGPTRNAGLQAARGWYVSFIDPDDYVEEKFYENLFEKASYNFDIIKGQRYKQYANLTREYSNYNSALKKDLKRGRKIYEILNYEHQSALYRRGVITNHPEVRFGTSLAAQDCTFLLSFTFYAENITFVEDAYYSYCIRDDSVIGKQGYNFFYGNVVALNEILDFLESHAQPGSYNRYLIMYEKVIRRRRVLLKKSKLPPDVKSNLVKQYDDVVARTHSLINLPWKEFHKKIKLNFYCFFNGI